MKMKYLYLFAALMLIVSACGGDNAAIVGNKTTMTVDPVFDGGKVLKGEVINAKFTVKNTGKYPLIISDVKGSCSCTVAEFPEDPIAPGDKGVILAYVKTVDAGTGPLNKSVRIVSNTDPSITQVMIKADVIAK